MNLHSEREYKKGERQKIHIKPHSMPTQNSKGQQKILKTLRKRMKEPIKEQETDY